MIEFLIIYLTWLLIGLVVFGAEYSDARTVEYRKYYARLIFLMPIWPLAVIYNLLRYGIPSMMRWTGRLFVDATRDLEQQL